MFHGLMNNPILIVGDDDRNNAHLPLLFPLANLLPAP
jgi:hypothetical protein